jgi:hypothetical protein
MLSLKNLTKRFFSRDRIIEAIQNITLDVAEREFLTIVGPTVLIPFDDPFVLHEHAAKFVAATSRCH